MKLLEFLKKIGLLRVGGQTAVYTSARERPLEFSRDELDPTPPPAAAPPEKKPDR
ncbi:MAG: hypothetical protein K6T55_02680 [Syntrophobacterales bacterium]|nr:hypothetical protein [Syntrophobacterales bacterium]